MYVNIFSTVSNNLSLPYEGFKPPCRYWICHWKYVYAWQKTVYWRHNRWLSWQFATLLTVAH